MVVHTTKRQTFLESVQQSGSSLFSNKIMDKYHDHDINADMTHVIKTNINTKIFCII